MTRITADWLDAAATRAVFDALTGAGHAAYAVGGCVRNTLLHRPVADVDIATDARPEQTIAAAQTAGLQAIPTGAAHGTITLVAGGDPFEVTTFRHDVDTDGRHAVVAFSDRLEDDAARRDFTMNALYADPDGHVIDPMHGLPDLRAGRLRFIGDPSQRIAEDYLRILRFFRFHAWYADPDGGIDAEGLAACAAGQDGLTRVSAERVGHEILRLLAADDPAPAVAAMESTGILARLLPGADTKGLAPLVMLEDGLPPDPLRRLAALGGEDPTERLRLSRAQTRRLELLAGAARDGIGVAEMSYRHGPQEARNSALIRSALLATPLPPTLDEDIARGAGAKFPVAAADLMPGLTGRALGARLRTLEAAWIASEFTLTRDALLALR
ncbi:CCA tRNA nucleotidyltransferase [Meridianimarinicoccus aquatilis]|uniref:CCA tRNA nucleotidyltransferase n=1 Tax=Meridianimarinicoccus aquatilis TaxID=2552766 RepID=A0A4R6AZ49_9RHOB|nr:CCA tRNA nucleotidyltransferase [Fluviibacterium aquatile]TDL89105.1 CCA tRNA nucleotidyltransferase [Fluviibacterium aquatile]